MKQQGDFYNPSTVIPNYTKNLIQINDPKPII
jgi:hypothetical protein